MCERKRTDRLTRICQSDGKGHRRAVNATSVARRARICLTFSLRPGSFIDVRAGQIKSAARINPKRPFDAAVSAFVVNACAALTDL